MQKLGKVLLVDDDEDTCRLMKSLLQQSNVFSDVVVSCNGEEALKKVKENQDIVFILLDINMPRMNGWEFLDLYEKEKKKKAVVVMLTVSQNPDDRKRAQQKKVGFANKPLKADDLKVILDTYLPGKS